MKFRLCLRIEVVVYLNVSVIDLPKANTKKLLKGYVLLLLLLLVVVVVLVLLYYLI